MSTETFRRASVVRRFNGALFILYLISILISAPLIYYVTYQQSHQQAEKELGVLVGMVRSIFGYVGGSMRPFLMQKDLYFPPGFSGVVALSNIAGHFKKEQPNYFIRTTSDNPLNPDNLPQPLEKELLFGFRNNRDLKEITTTGILDNQELLVFATPMESEKGCLRCHGDPGKVIPEITNEYDTVKGSGYRYNIGDIVGTTLVGVPIQNIMDLALERSVYVIGLLTVIFALIFITLNMIVRRYLIRPILELNQAVQNITRGDIDREIDLAARSDEIGELGRSIELLRRSFAQAMKRLRK